VDFNGVFGERMAYEFIYLRMGSLEHDFLHYAVVLYDIFGGTTVAVEFHRCFEERVAPEFIYLEVGFAGMGTESNRGGSHATCLQIHSLVICLYSFIF